MDGARQWWQEAVVYQVYPRSFNDSDGDGIGDLRGIIDRVDYLDDLGIDVVWLSPFYESPQADMGYDVRDYRAVDDQFGTMAEFDELLGALHDRGIRLIIDQIVNHTSDEHEWFVRSRSSREDPKRDWYHWHPGDDGPPNNWDSFFGGSAWEYDEHTDEYYLHTYHTKQPDLNWANPEVREAVYEMLRWWLDKGVDGFRLDVINHLSKPAGYPDGDPERDWTGTGQFFNGPRIHEYVAELHEEVLDDYDAMYVGETPGVDVAEAQRYIDDGLDMIFQFEHMGIDRGTDGRWDPVEWHLEDLREILARWQTGMVPDGWNAPYLTNHDQPRTVSRFGDEAYRYESATLALTVLLTLRGTPHLYQGQELGMTNADFSALSDVRDPHTINHMRSLMADGDLTYEDVRPLVNAQSRDNARTPMQWDDSDNAGFSDGDPWIQVGDDYTEVNVADQRADPDSVWHHARELLALRDDHDALAAGEFDLLASDHPTVFAYRRTAEQEEAVVVCNWSDEPTSLRLPGTDGASLWAANYPVGDTPPSLELRPYEARVYGR